MRPNPSRRELLLAAAAATAAAGFLGDGGCAAPLTDASPPTRLLPNPQPESVRPDDPADARPELFPPPDWSSSAAAVDGSGLVVRFADPRTIAGSARLRVTCAADVRASGRLLVSLAASGRPLGEIAVRDPYPLQPLELALSAADGEAARVEGVRVRAAMTPAGATPADATPAAPTGTVPIASARMSVFVASAGPAGRPAAGFLPQLLVGAGADPAEQLRDRLASADVAQPFGWMAGCVLDAQQDLAEATADPRYAAAAGLLLGLLLTPDGRVARPALAAAALAGGRTAGGPPAGEADFRSVTDTLVVAAVARRNPGHSLVDRALRFWESRRDAAGCVQDGTVTTAVGAYTVAYPMAVVAAARRVPALAEAAAQQLTIRLRRLVRDERVVGRVEQAVGRVEQAGPGTRRTAAPAGVATAPATTKATPATTTTTAGSVANDATTLAWWLLGLARTLREMPPAARPPELTAELARAAEWARLRQPADGVWPAVVRSAVVQSPAPGRSAPVRPGAGEPPAEAEPAATAGMAAAMALAGRAGLLPPTATAAARKAWAGLRGRLTPDGYLTGPAGREFGEAIGLDAPRAGRVGHGGYSPFATGLAGQLLAALQPAGERA